MRFLFCFIRNGSNYETKLPGDVSAEKTHLLGAAFAEETHLFRGSTPL